ncbi:MAG: septal ring lytic transglycosylase RlpA family protein [Balneolaceae bacterium]|nr:septal ring lytic transglycosylase RlpA family protein [Balneolaceae bacterium]
MSTSLLLIFLTSCGMTGRVNKKGSIPAGKGETIETGVASWYGPNFHGKLTANGETYDMNGLTAAHRTLPFNTVLRVENQDNGQSVVVRINDRGPFAKNRIIDLSKGAAQKIDMLGPGTANVKLVLLEGDLENSRTTNLKVATYTVQLGSYQTERDALNHAQKIRNARIEEIKLDGETIYRVYYGIYTDKDKAKNKRNELRRNGFDCFVKQIQND